MVNKENDSFNSDTYNSLDIAKNRNYKLIIIMDIIGVIMIAFAILLIIFNSKSERSKILVNMEKNDYLKFTINNKDYFLGDKIDIFKKNNLNYDTDFGVNIIHSDSISTRTFYNKDNKSQFLGVLYCSSEVNYNYNDTVLIKANFYENSKVLVNNFIKFGMTYENIVKKYGKEDGKFYQDEELRVWTFDKLHKVGSPYYVLRFDERGLFSIGGINEIRIGVWWYDDEYEHTVIK